MARPADIPSATLRFSMATVIPNLFAGLVLALCIALLVRLCLSPARQRRVDAAARQAWWTIRQRTLGALRWNASRKKARAATDEALRRAREGEWQGNVYKPKSFRKPRKPH
jgi:ABC-type transport system involved in cytochrome bd biosynthesis fused ATPase/permease subunit